jgi:thymidylate kinase
MKNTMNKGIVSVIGFEGPNRVGKGTQIARLYRYLEDRNIPCLIVRGSGSRPASGAHTGDPLSQWWFRTNQSLKTTANLDMWQVSANRLAREFILWRDFFFPRMLRRKKAQHGVILVDRTVLSQFMILRETGVTDWNKLYPDIARSLGRKITGDMVCPDVIINLVAPKETLLSRLDSSDPKHDFRRLLIETKSHWYLDTMTMLPRRIQNKIRLVGADGTVDMVFGHILDTLLSHRTISKVLQPKKVVK